MNISYLSQHIENLLQQTLTFKYPADGVVRYYFKSNPKLGQHDRQYIANALFSILRNLALFRHLAQSSSGNLNQKLALLGLLYQRIRSGNRVEGVQQQDYEWLKHLAKIDVDSIKANIRYSMPDWLWQELKSNHDEQTVKDIAQSMLMSSNLDIRVNTIKASPDKVMEEFYQNNILAQFTKYAPNALRLDAKTSIHQTALFEAGWFEIQDEGSQILCHILNPKRGEMVVDFCAGAGGKTLALGAMMRSTGRIYAFDVDAKRLKKIKPRIARSGLSNVYTALIANENDSHIKRLQGKIDKVLLDVPCSGIGTLKRNPDLKWRQTPQGIKELTQKQASILQHSSKLLKVGGVVLYATCSLLKAENEDIIENFLQNNPNFKLLSISEILNKQNIDISYKGMLPTNYLRLYPHIHGTDGFFAALLQKI